MKTKSAVFSAAALLLVTGCVTTAPQQQQQVRQDVPNCAFPANPKQAAPNWVCAPATIAGVKDVALGVHPKSVAGYQFSHDQAAAKARAALASQVRSNVTATVMAAVDGKGIGATEVADLSQKTANAVDTREALAGSKVVQSTVDEAGNVYVAVGMDIEASRRMLQQAVQTSMRNEPDTWKRAAGSRSPAELQADILKMGDRT